MKKLIQKLLEFRDERDWDQFHNPKDLAIALNVEAGELLETFLWKNHDEASVVKVREELADILIYALLLSDKYGFDIEEIVAEKIEKNKENYPVEKAKGNALKYTEL